MAEMVRKNRLKRFLDRLLHPLTRLYRGLAERSLSEPAARPPAPHRGPMGEAPEHWLGRALPLPPSDWLERVRKLAPQLLARELGDTDYGSTATAGVPVRRSLEEGLGGEGPESLPIRPVVYPRPASATGRPSVLEIRSTRAPAAGPPDEAHGAKLLLRPIPIALRTRPRRLPETSGLGSRSMADATTQPSPVGHPHIRRTTPGPALRLLTRPASKNPRAGAIPCAARSNAPGLPSADSTEQLGRITAPLPLLQESIHSAHEPPAAKDRQGLVTERRASPWPPPVPTLAEVPGLKTWDASGWAALTLQGAEWAFQASRSPEQAPAGRGAPEQEQASVSSDRWPQLLEAGLMEDEEPVSALQEWEHTQRLDREQRGLF